jgi:hypothetical protein
MTRSLHLEPGPLENHLRPTPYLLSHWTELEALRLAQLCLLRRHQALEQWFHRRTVAKVPRT